jgi:hypothetical protein
VLRQASSTTRRSSSGSAAASVTRTQPNRPTYSATPYASGAAAISSAWSSLDAFTVMVGESGMPLAIILSPTRRVGCPHDSTITSLVPGSASTQPRTCS